MTEKYNSDQHNQNVMSILQPAINAYREYLTQLQVPQPDIEDCTKEIIQSHGKGIRTASAFVQFINGLLNLDL